MRRGDPQRIRAAQRAGLVARIASARNVDAERAGQLLAALESTLDGEGVERDSYDWHVALECRAFGAPQPKAR